MTVALMAMAGVLVGFLLDAAVAHLARQPYLAPEEGEQEQPHAGLDLASERGALQMPALLDDKAWYRRAAIVAASALLFALVGAKYGGDATHLAVMSLYVSGLLVCAATDLLSFRVANVVTYPLILAALVIGMTIDGASRSDVLFGGLLFGGLLLVPSVLTGAMGMGDVKLGLFAGLALGFSYAVPALVLMALGGGAAALFLLAIRARGRRDAIPYAPFIAGGTLVVMLVQGTAFASL